MLKNIQNMFIDAIFDSKKSAYPSERLDIYRRTIFENCRHALQLTFPGVWALIGESCANAAAYYFLKNKENFPKTGCLDDWGFNFPGFLGSQKDLRSVPYLKDYAEYEWVQHLSYHAFDEESLSLNVLRAFSEEALEALRFILVPSCFLFSSYYPIDEIENIVKNDRSPNINLIKSKKTAVIMRANKKVETFWLPVDQWFFILQIKNGRSLKKATEAVMKKYPAVDLPEALHFLFKHSLISKIYS